MRITMIAVGVLLSGCRKDSTKSPCSSVLAQPRGDGRVPAVSSANVERILRDADLHASDGAHGLGFPGLDQSDSERCAEGREQVGGALANATWVLLGTVTDANSTVWAVPDRGVASPQGWGSWRIHVDEVVKGTLDEKSVEVTGSGSCGMSTIDLGVFSCHQPILYGHRYYFFLTEDERLSRWCDTKVYHRELSVALRQQ